MQWFYAVNGQRFGPVSSTDFARLVADGTVAGDTLVWKEGMASWVAWSTIAASTELPRVDASAAPTLPVPAYDTGSTAGESADVEDWSLEEFTTRLRANGFRFPIEGGLKRIWSNMTNGYWVGLGVCLVASFLMVIAGLIPLVGLAATFVVTPQLTAGMAWYFLQRQRGTEPAFDAVFDGFRHRFGSLALVALVQVAAVLVIAIIFALIAIPLGVSFQGMEQAGSEAVPAMGLATMLMFFFVIFVVTVLACRFLLVHLIVMDQSMGVIDALRLSWRITGMSFWPLVGVGLVIVVAYIVGMIPLFIGVVLLMPLGPAAIAQVYEEARLSAAGTPLSE